jgi:hypothetical protein
MDAFCAKYLCNGVNTRLSRNTPMAVMETANCTVSNDAAKTNPHISNQVDTRHFAWRTQSITAVTAAHMMNTKSRLLDKVVHAMMQNTMIGAMKHNVPSNQNTIDSTLYLRVLLLVIVGVLDLVDLVTETFDLFLKICVRCSQLVNLGVLCFDCGVG